MNIYKYKSKGKLTKRKSKAKATKSYVKTIVNKLIETKHHTILWGPFSANNSFLLQDLTYNAQGTSDILHIGDRITVDSIRLHLCVSYATLTHPGLLRMIVFKYKYDSTVAPSVTDLLYSVNTATDATLGPRDFDVSPMFTVYYDKTFNIDPIDKYQIVKKINLKKLGKVCYTGASNDGVNHIYCMFYYADSQSSANTCTVNLYSTVFFKDA